MYSILLLIAFIAFLAYIDHRRFWRQTDDFFRKARDLCGAYNTVLARMKEPKGETEIISYEGTDFVLVVNYGDYKDFIKKMQILV